jgi:hypothetical protein
VPIHDARILRFAERPMRAQPVKHQDPDLAISRAVSVGSRHLLGSRRPPLGVPLPASVAAQCHLGRFLGWNLVGLAAQSKRFFTDPKCRADMHKRRLTHAVCQTYRG